jgi:membrane protein implicated in regulation of membrane protease activity
MFYLICASAGFVLLVVRIILMIAGIGHGADVDTHVDVHTDIHGGDAGGHDVSGHGHHGDSDTSFKMLTLQGIMGFLLMFGLTGYVLNGTYVLGSIISAAGATTAGLASMWIIAKLFSMLMKLQSSGTIEIANAVGQEGNVYLTIPPGGVGKVQVVVQGRLQEFEAVCDSKTELKSGETVLVVYYKGNTLVVHKI